MTTHSIQTHPSLAPHPGLRPEGARAPTPRRLGLRHLIRVLVALLVRALYRVRVEGELPSEGPAIVVANHASYVDSLVLAARCAYPMRFAYWSGFDRVFFVGWLFRVMGGIPIGPRSSDPAVYEAAMAEIERSLRAGEVIGIFPEGRLSPDGGLGEFRDGIERIVRRCPVPVTPVGLCGLYESLWSKSRGRRRWAWRRRVVVRVGEALAPPDASAQALRRSVQALMA